MDDVSGKRAQGSVTVLEVDGLCSSVKSFQGNVCAEYTGEKGKGKKACLFIVRKEFFMQSLVSQL